MLSLDNRKDILNFLTASRALTQHSFSRKTSLFPATAAFSLQRLGHLLANPLLTPEWLQVSLNGQALDLGSDHLWKYVQHRKLCFTDKAQLNTALAKGASLVLEGVDILDPDVNQLLGEIDDTLPCALSTCEAFFSRRGNEAYGGHRDSDDVLALQISGQKSWRVHAPQQRRYMGNSPLTEQQMGPLVEEFIMSPGDALYVRAGVPHRCSTVSDCSLHLSIDLYDRTPNIEEITQAANQLHNQELAPMYCSPKQVVEHYIRHHLSSPALIDSIEQATTDMKAQCRSFRHRVGQASTITLPKSLTQDNG